MALENDFFKEHVHGFYIRDDHIYFDVGRRFSDTSSAKP